MMEEVLAWLQRSEGPAAYAVLGLASLIEYVVPPFPGDSVALFGIFLAVSAGYRVGWVYLALNLGALAGGMTTYAFGRWLGRRRLERMPRFLRTHQIRGAIDTALERFTEHGAAYLALNRFLPALRAVFFVAAGMAGLPAWRVAVWGTLSACVWNALLLGIGWWLGDNLERLERWVETYSYVAMAVAALAIGIAIWRFRRAGRAGAEPTERDGDDADPKPEEPR